MKVCIHHYGTANITLVAAFWLYYWVNFVAYFPSIDWEVFVAPRGVGSHWVVMAPTIYHLIEWNSCSTCRYIYGYKSTDKEDSRLLL